MGVHLRGAYNVTRPAFVKMREQGYGRVVLTTFCGRAVREFWSDELQCGEDGVWWG